MTNFFIVISLIATLVILGFVINSFNDGIIVKKTKFIYAKIMQFVGFSQRKHFFYPLLCVFIYVVVSVLYLILAYSQTLIDFSIYEPTLSGTSGAQQLEKAAKSFVLAMNNFPAMVFGFVGVILLILVTLYLLRRKKLSYKAIIILIVLLAGVIRIAYSFSTDNIFVRQHDVYSTNYNGHYAITMHIYETFLPPELINGSLDASYQLYHPKMSHYIFAIFMHINSLFIHGEASFTLYESIRILTCTISIIEIIMVYHIFKLLSKDNKTVAIVGTFFMAVAPLFIRLSSMSNNDPLLYFFMIMSLLFALRFYKTFKWSDIILSAFAVSMAVGTKISGVIIAIPVALIFVMAIFKFVKENNIKSIYKLAIKYGVFLVIALPIALFWPIYQYVNYGQDLMYLWTKLNKNLLVDPSFTYADRFLSFPVDRYFNNLFMSLWASARPYQDYNIYIALMKSSIFGEFSYGNLNTIAAAFLSGINFILVIGIMLVGLYEIINRIVNKRYVTAAIILIPIFFYLGFVFEHIALKIVMFVIVGALAVYLSFNNKETLKYKNHLLILITTLTLLIVYLNLQISTPYTCSMDYRYVGLLSLCGGYFIGYAFDKANKSKHSKPLIAIYSSILLLYGAASTLLYISLGIY